MKKILIITIVIIPMILAAQSDLCGSGATLLTVGTACSYSNGTSLPTGTSDPFTSSCGGNEDDDKFYKFVATSSSTIINLDSDAGYDFVLTVLSNCSTQVACSDNTFDDGIESLKINTTPGNTYYIQVHSKAIGGGTFKICVSESVNCASSVTPTDFCSAAPLINDFSNFCGTTAGYSVGTSPSSYSAPCGITLQNDSWLKFVASESNVSINWYIPCGAQCSYGVQFAIFGGSCSSLSYISGTCVNPTGGAGSSGTWNIAGLTVGNTYYIMIDGYAGDICEYYFFPQSGVQVTCNANAGNWN